MTTAHTPTPWYLEPRHASNDDVIASVIGTTDIIAAKNPATFADAAHIVKCVNLHDELVEALKDAREELSEYELNLSGETYKNTSLNEALKKAGAL